MPKQINTPTPGQRLVQLFGLKGRYQPVLDETIVPVVSVEEVQEVRGAMAYAQVPAAAGEFPFCRVSNPINSGFLITMEEFRANVGGNTSFWALFAGFSLVGATVVGEVTQWRDSQRAGLPGAVLDIGSQLAAAIPAGAHRWQMQVGGTGAVAGFAFDGKVWPGDFLIIWADVLNNLMQYSMQWTETTINPTNI